MKRIKRHRPEEKISKPGIKADDEIKLYKLREVNSMADLNALYQWFNENREDIIQNHAGECVLIKDNSVIGYFPNSEAALSSAETRCYAMGDFLIQDCVSKVEDTMMYYNQAVCFG
jgi:putative alpha-1,2-mannosidase